MALDILKRFTKSPAVTGTEVTDPAEIARMEGASTAPAVKQSGPVETTDPAEIAAMEGKSTPQFTVDMVPSHTSISPAIKPLPSHQPMDAPLSRFMGGAVNPMSIASPSDRQSASSLRRFVTEDVPTVATTFGAKVGAGLEQSVGGTMQAIAED
jgi:hypothetical protein